MSAVQRPDPEEQSQHYADKDKAKAESAFADFVQLGPQRSVQKLLDMYQERRRVDGSEANVPTTNRSKIYRWSKDYDWNTRAYEIDQQQAEDAQKDYAAIRRVRLGELANLSKHAVETLEKLLDVKDESVRLRAAEAILNRVGLTQQTPHNPKGKEPSAEQTKAVEPPPTDANVTEIQEWLREQRKHQ